MANRTAEQMDREMAAEACRLAGLTGDRSAGLAQLFATVRADERARIVAAGAWTATAPTQPGEFWWRDTRGVLTARPRIVCARWFAPDGRQLPTLAAGPWSGGLTPVAEMVGEWQPVEPAKL